MLCTEEAGGKNSRSMVISLQSAPHTTRLYCCTDLSSNHTTFTSHMQQRDYASSAQVQNKLPFLCLACGKAILYNKGEQPIHRFAAHLFLTSGHTQPHPLSWARREATITQPHHLHAFAQRGQTKNSRSMVISLQSAPHTTRLYCCTDLSSNHTTFTSHMQQRDYASSAQVQNKLPSLCLACGKAIPI